MKAAIIKNTNGKFAAVVNWAGEIPANEKFIFDHTAKALAWLNCMRPVAQDQLVEITLIKPRQEAGVY